MNKLVDRLVGTWISLPKYALVQVLGVALFAVLSWMLGLAKVEEPERYLPDLVGGWTIICVGGYLWSYGVHVRSLWSERTLWQLPEIVITLAICSWGILFGWMERLEILYIILAVVYALRHRRCYRLGGLQVLYPSMVLLSSIALLWASDFVMGLQVLERQVTLVLLPLTAIWMPISRVSIPRIVSWIARFLLLFMTLQCIVYIFLAGHYTSSLWDCFTFDKRYLDHLPGVIIYHKLMLWSSTIHPSWWMLFLSLPWFIVLDYKLTKRLNQGVAEVSGLLSTGEWVLYGGLLVLFAFINQPRYAIWVLAMGVVWPLVRWALATYSSRIVGGGLLVIFGGIAGLFTLGPTLSILGDTERVGLTNNALEHIGQSLPWGMGLGADGRIQQQLFQHNHSHNNLLTMVVDMGVMGAVLMIALWGLSLWLATKRQNTPFLVFFLLLFPLMLIDSVLYVRSMAHLIALYVCLLAGYTMRRSD